MARYVRISTIGAPYLNVDTTLPYGKVWEYMKAHLTTQVNQVLPDNPDLIVLPEMCDIPNGYSPSLTGGYVDHRGTENIEFFAEIARENNCNISFSTITRGKGDYCLNTTCLLNRDGSAAGIYDKYYVVPIEYEWNIKCGTETPMFELDIGKVVCAICFDLNFDDLRNRYKLLKPELILFSSMYHGGLKQHMWAQACRAYFVGAIAHSRPSAIISPLGETVAYSTNYQNYITATVNMDYELIHLKYMEELRELKKKYGKGATIFDPGNIGYVLLTSERDDISAAEMMREFGMTNYDEYIAESIMMREDPANQGERK